MRSSRRLLQLFAFLAAWALVIIARLVQIQIIRHDDYVARAQRQQERTLALSPVRGSILDAQGRVLAESVAAESVYADPQAITDRRAASKALASIRELDMTAEEIFQKLGSDGGFVWIGRQLPLEITARIRALRVPGIYFLEEHRRAYPRGPLAANVVSRDLFPLHFHKAREHIIKRRVCQV